MTTIGQNAQRNSSPTGQALQRVMEGLKQLPSPPEICLAISRAAQSEKTTLTELQKLVESDVGLAGRLLQVANCAFFGVRERVASVRQAITLLGFQTVRTVALGFFLHEDFGRLRLPGLPYPDLPRYAIATSVVCEAIAQAASPRLAAEAATAGLLHECGPIAMAMAFGQQYRECLTTLTASHTDLCAVERQAFGIDHAAAGELLLSRWRLPEVVVQSVARHHSDESPVCTDRLAIPLWKTLTLGCTASLLFFGGRYARVTAEALRLARRHFHWTAGELAAVVRSAAPLYRNRASIFSLSDEMVEEDSVQAVEASRALSGV